MNDQGDTDRTAALLRAALTAAADVMAVHEAPARQHANHAKHPKRAWGRLAPLAAAAGVMAIAAGTVIGAHLTSPSDTRSAQAQGPAGTTAQAPRPEFYLTVTYPASGPNVLQFQVRRTIGGAVTGSRTISGANVGWGGYLTAAAGDRTFYFARYLCPTNTTAPHTTFDRITITSSGQISGFAPGGQPVQGMVTVFAVSPDGSQMAYNALPGLCRGDGFRSTAAAAVSVENLSTGAIRTWQDTTAHDVVDRLSWATDGRTLIVEEQALGLAHLNLSVFALDPSSDGGSLQARSTTRLRQDSNCSTCVATALAGPDGSLTELESQVVGKRTYLLVVSVPSAPGSRATVLYRHLSDAPGSRAVNAADLFADPSGQWVLLWPMGISSPRSAAFAADGWISGGRLHPLPGVAQVFPQGIAW